LRGWLGCPMCICAVSFRLALAVADQIARMRRQCNAQVLWPWYCHNESMIASFFRSLITGWLPALLLNLWLVLVLPRLVYLLVQVGVVDLEPLDLIDACIDAKPF